MLDVVVDRVGLQEPDDSVSVVDPVGAVSSEFGNGDLVFVCHSVARARAHNLALLKGGWYAMNKWHSRGSRSDERRR